MNFARHVQVLSALNKSNAEIGADIRQCELDQGFTLVTEAKWFLIDDWSERTIISQDGKRIRLVALEARRPGSGAFTRLIGLIFAAGLTPVLVEPNDMLTSWCHRHNFRHKRVGQGKHRANIWYPRQGWR